MERIWLGEKQRKITRIDHAGWNEPSWLSQSLTFLGFQRRPAFKNNIFFSNPETLQAVSSQNQLNNYGKTTSYNNNHETNLLIHSYRNKVIMIMKDQTWQFCPYKLTRAKGFRTTVVSSGYFFTISVTFWSEGAHGKHPTGEHRISDEFRTMVYHGKVVQ